MPKVKKKVSAKPTPKESDQCAFCAGTLTPDKHGILLCSECHRPPGHIKPEIKPPAVVHPQVGPRRMHRP
jgi:hypothetical protein